MVEELWRMVARLQRPVWPSPGSDPGGVLYGRVSDTIANRRGVRLVGVHCETLAPASGERRAQALFAHAL